MKYIVNYYRILKVICFKFCHNNNNNNKLYLTRVTRDRRTISIYMKKTKKSKKYITIIRYPYNEYLQTIITIRIQLGWVKREEGCEMPD